MLKDMNVCTIVNKFLFIYMYFRYIHSMETEHKMKPKMV